jgi:hypothetical protein
MQFAEATLPVIGFPTLGSFCVKIEDLAPGSAVKALTHSEHCVAAVNFPMARTRSSVVQPIKSTGPLASAKDCRIFVVLGQASAVKFKR